MDWRFQQPVALSHELLNWAEQETTKIEDFAELGGGDDKAETSGELFNIISTTVQGEALQLMHNCDFNSAEA